MLIIVATKNIFRRELTSYTLIEAGHDVREIVEIAQLAYLVAHEQPALVIADATIAEIDTVLQTARASDAIPLLWIGRGNPGHHAGGGVGHLDWPYRPDELLSSVTRLSVRELTPQVLNPSIYAQRAIGQND